MWIVDQQEGLVIVQVPVPIGGFWSEVKIPPANTAMSVDWAKLRLENKSVQNNAPRMLFKMTSQQRLNRWRHYKGSCPRRRCSLSHFDTTLVTLVLRGAVVGRMIVPNRQSAPVPHVLLS